MLEHYAYLSECIDRIIGDRELNIDKSIWFKSTKFTIEKGEDKETSPLYFGKSLAIWLSQQFSELGYDTKIVPKNWGWSVICESNGYLLWLGCGCVIPEELRDSHSSNNPPKGSDVTWNVFSTIEVPLFNFKALFQKWTGKLDLETPLKRLNGDLESVLKSESMIVICEKPQL